MDPEIIQDNKWLVIVNPNAGRRKGETDWPVISSLLKESGLEFESFFTTGRGHAIELTKKNVENGYKNILVVGGDGTLNEVVNGIFDQTRYKSTDITVGLIMVGAGNDWGRMYNLNNKYKKAIKAIWKNRLFIQDTCLVTYHNEGIDAKRYLVNLLKGLFSYRLASLQINVDGQTVYSGRVFSMNVGICKFNGGGMMQLPFAVPDDGLLDVTIFKKVTKMTVIRNLKKLYAGTFTNLPFVQIHRGKVVEVSSLSSHQAKLEIDGEYLGLSPFRFEIVPLSLKVITGKKWLEITSVQSKESTDA